MSPPPSSPLALRLVVLAATAMVLARAADSAALVDTLRCEHRSDHNFTHQ